MGSPTRYVMYEPLRGGEPQDAIYQFDICACSLSAPERILLVKEDYDDVLYKVIEDKDGSAPNQAKELNCCHLTLSLIS